MANTVAVYKDTKELFVSNLYTAITSRSKGTATNRPYLYEGLPVASRDEFMDWALTDKDLDYLYANWQKNNYDSLLTPSVDRKDTTEGYVLGNMRWITASHNYSIGASNNIIKLNGKQVKPLLAVKLEDPTKVRFPLYASPKLDGIRCLVINGKAVTRKLKPVPNDFIRNTLETQFKDLNVDGELMVPGMDFNEIQGEVMRKTGEPRFTYTVFDIVDPELTYEERREKLTDPRIAYPLQGVKISNQQHLDFYEKWCVETGYEGIMLRSPEGKYKYGRSTAKEGILLKLKRFEDSEARVIGFEERMHNANAATTDALGHTERSSAKAGMVPTNTLGSLVVYDDKLKVQFNIGTGFDDEYRKLIWDHRDEYLNKTVTYEYQELSKYGVPRFPSFKGFRHEDDISE